ncbi:MAG: hypothetical protein M3Y42_19805 [Actinomycetota bacterium]|nr:hypothetical protein [Actinomycetota bacterium]
MTDTADPASFESVRRSTPHVTHRIIARESLGGRPFGGGTAPGPVAAAEAVPTLTERAVR